VLASEAGDEAQDRYRRRRRRRRRRRPSVTTRAQCAEGCTHR
jgi:hypothetical protein